MALVSPTFDVVLINKYAIQLPSDPIQPFLDQNEKRVKVRASYQGNSVDFHAALQKRKGNYFMMFGKRNQEKIGLDQNDYFTLQLFEDTTRYGVEMPEEMEAVLTTDYDAYQLFEKLTDGFKRSLIYAISRYKLSQTKIDKTLILCENLKMGITDRKNILKPV